VSENDALIRLRRVTKTYGDSPAVDALDLDVASSRTTVLIGPSGCGKSTTLRLMNGLVLPSAGEVLFADEPVTAQTAPALRRRMGYVIQEGGLFPHLTARENVCLMARHLGMERDQIETRIAELARLTHFPEDALDRYPQELSGGQRQRVSLMRALMLDPDVLLLDEPLGALDPMIRYDLQNELRDIFAGLRKTVVLVTHDLGEAAFFGDHIVLMRDGRIEQAGTMRDLLEMPASGFVERFVTAQRGVHELP
jgi:osmoprotectant transport system ATP-binding protein